MLNLQDVAPKFSLKDSSEGVVSLDGFLGKYVVVYFCPKDNTPGCTMEAKDFRNNIAKFEQLNAVVIGVSRDSCSKHQSFINKYDLPFNLLADTTGKLCQEFGVLVEKSMFGKKYQGIDRSTFIINPQGELAEAIPQFKQAVLTGHIYAAKGSTPWIRSGDAPWLILLFGFLVLALRGEIYKKIPPAR